MQREWKAAPSVSLTDSGALITNLTDTLATILLSSRSQRTARCCGAAPQHPNASQDPNPQQQPTQGVGMQSTAAFSLLMHLFCNRCFYPGQNFLRRNKRVSSPKFILF